MSHEIPTSQRNVRRVPLGELVEAAKLATAVPGSRFQSSI